MENRGRKLSLENNPCTVVDQSWIQKTALSFLTPEEKAGKDVILVHGHHDTPGSPLVTTLQTKRSQIPVVISMRDPMLSLNTLIWRTYARYKVHYQHEDQAIREDRAQTVAARFKDILKIPCKNRFLFPVDTDAAKELEGRINLASDLFKYCGLKLRKPGLDFVYDWRPIGLTEDGTLLCKRERGVEGFNEAKNMILSGDVTGMKRILGVEYECLHQDDELKELLEQVGYVNLSWW
jgi:hypothetical protein